MLNYSRTFFTGKKAFEFIEFLESKKATEIHLSIYDNGFGKKVYRVEWNLEDIRELKSINLHDQTKNPKHYKKTRLHLLQNVILYNHKETNHSLSIQEVNENEKVQDY